MKLFFCPVFRSSQTFCWLTSLTVDNATWNKVWNVDCWMEGFLVYWNLKIQSITIFLSFVNPQVKRKYASFSYSYPGIHMPVESLKECPIQYTFVVNNIMSVVDNSIKFAVCSILILFYPPINTDNSNRVYLLIIEIL